MSDTKTTPAPAADLPEERERQLLRDLVDRWRYMPPDYGDARRTFSTHLAQLRAADARSARRFEGL